VTVAEDRVHAALEGLIADGPDLGLHVAVFQQGELIIDASAGVSDPETRTPVTADTLFWASSNGKGVAATCLHVLAERDAIQYEAPVARYWPEFGANGKGAVTVRQVLSHTAGVPYPPDGIGLNEFTDWQATVDGIAALPLAWEPGTKIGYHNYTFGFIVGELIRRIDGRTIDAFLQQEICQPLALDGLFFAVPDSQLGRVATRVPDNDFNRREIRQACIPSSGLFANARSLAKFYALLANGGQLDGVRMLSPERVQLVSQVQSYAMDEIYHVKVKRGLGYRLGDDTGPGAGPRALGHVGAGMFSYADPEANLAIAFVKNFIDLNAGWRSAEIVQSAVARELASRRE
jgi:CubicO group peptidase (beta-lactamase class C family)